MTPSQVTSQQAVLAESEAVLALVDGAFDGMAIWEAAPWRVRYANPAFWQLIRGPAEAIRADSAANEVPTGLRIRMTELLDRFWSLGAEASPLTTSLDAGADRKEHAEEVA